MTGFFTHRRNIWVLALLGLLLAFLMGCAGAEPPAQTPEAAPTESAAPDYSGLLRLSELAPKNRAGALAPGFPDWVELENISGETLSLEGWRLTDRRGKAGLSLGGERLAPGELRLVSLAEADFSLSEGEMLYLFSPDGAEQDSSPCDAAADCSLQRLADGSFAETPWITPGFANDAAGYEAYASSRAAPEGLCLWEVMVSNEKYRLRDGSLCDWVELRNNGGAALSLEGWTLSDDLETTERWAFPAQSLGPGELLVVACDEDREPSEKNTGFSLSAVSETLYLFDPEGKLYDWVSLHDITVEGSMGRSLGEDGFFYFTQPSPGAENGRGARRISLKPTALTAPGIYEDVDGVTVELAADGDIYYTTDGSLPNENSKRYTEPIRLNATGVIRAVAEEPGALLSRPSSFTYIINEGHVFPVLSLCSNTAGAVASAMEEQAKYVNLPVNLSLYDENGEVFSHDGEWALSGWTSLRLPKKSMSVSFTGRYGGDLRCELFGDGVDRYSSLSIRAGQDYPFSFFRNELCQELCREASDAVYTQASRYCILYLNGKYWGLYSLKEDLSRQFYASHAGVDADTVVANRAPISRDTPFRPVADMGWKEDLSQDEPYQRFCAQVDIDSLIDWFLLECFVANTDTQGNLRLYRSSEGDGKWDFVFYDLDWCFYWVEGSFYGFLGGGNNSGSDLPRLILNLSYNPDFRDRVFRRYAELTSTVLTDEHLQELVDRFAAEIAPEMPREIDRWGSTMEHWEGQVQILRDYVTEWNWTNYTIDQLLFRFRATDEEALRYFGRTSMSNFGKQRS